MQCDLRLGYRDEVGAIFETLGRQFSNCLAYRNEIVAAEARGDLAYTVALEHTTASINGAEPAPYVLRVTTIFRREGGEWKVVHRHGDAAADSGAVVGRSASGPAANCPRPSPHAERLRPDLVGYLRYQFELALLGFLADEVPPIDTGENPHWVDSASRSRPM
jgi:hypothetical protein